MKTKVCGICGLEKPIEEFAKKSGRKNGVSYCCILCNRLRHKKWYAENKEERAEVREANREETREYDRKIYKKNKPRVRARQKVFYDTNAEAIMDQQREAMKENPESALFRLAKTRANSQGIPFTIQLSDIEIPEFCPVLGLKLEFGEMSRRNNSPSLDRVDSSRGYVPGNVAVISWRANRLKNDGTAEEFQKLIEYIETFQKTHVCSTIEPVIDTTTRLERKKQKRQNSAPFGSDLHRQRMSESATARWAKVHESQPTANIEVTA